MDLMQIGSQLLAQQFGGKVSGEQATSALGSLMGDGKGGIDIGSLVSKIGGTAGLGSMVQSWLGDGGNDAINPAQILQIFGGDKIAQFSSMLGVSDDEATSGLSGMLPDLIDKSSSGGNLLDSIGGVGGALNLAKGLFK